MITRQFNTWRSFRRANLFLKVEVLVYFSCSMPMYLPDRKVEVPCFRDVLARSLKRWFPMPDKRIQAVQYLSAKSESLLCSFEFAHLHRICETDLTSVRSLVQPPSSHFNLCAWVDVYTQPFCRRAAEAP